MLILTVNAGSSSIRLDAFFSANNRLQRLGDVHQEQNAPLLAPLLELAEEASIDLRAFDVVAHRWVHGGPDLTGPLFLTPALEATLEELSSLAPLHNPSALAWLRLVRSTVPAARHVVVPDTGYFSDLPLVAQAYALPRALCEQFHVRRYGFHGLAHQSMWEAWVARCGNMPGDRVVTLQLGSGASAAAIRGGSPLDTSMGFTPLEGLVMASRPGDIDPGLLMYLQRTMGMNFEAMEDLLSHHSGLIGLSDVSGDIRTLLSDSSSAARHALNVYTYRIRKYIGSYAAVLGGLDGIVFGGGVGENSSEIRSMIMGDLDWLGVNINVQDNLAPAGNDGWIHSSNSSVKILVAQVNEATMMARAVQDVAG